MSTNLNPNPNTPATHDQPAAKTNEDFNKKAPLPADPDLSKTQPESETPVILADEIKDSEDAIIDEADFFPATARADYLDIIDE